MLARVQPDPDWIVGKHALMNVHARLQDGRTVIEPHSWRMPFQWQGCHYQDHDDEPFMLLLNSAGGFVEGDVSQFHATLDAGTRALFTTTASTKFYKCVEQQTSREIVDILVGPEAMLEYCPDEAIPFERSRTQRINRITMDKSSRMFATDMISAGRIHYGDGEAFKFDSLVSEFEIRIDNSTIALDRLSATTPQAVAALPRLWHGAFHMATVFAYAPDLPHDIEDAVLSLTRDVEETESGVTRIGNLVIVRILANETWQAHEAIYNAWEALRPAIAGKPARPISKC
jgi:urease accessory protein